MTKQTKVFQTVSVNVLKPIPGGFKVGSTVNVECFADGAPVDRTWRKVFANAGVHRVILGGVENTRPGDGCVELAAAPSTNKKAAAEGGTK